MPWCSHLNNDYCFENQGEWVSLQLEHWILRASLLLIYLLIYWSCWVAHIITSDQLWLRFICILLIIAFTFINLIFPLLQQCSYSISLGFLLLLIFPQPQRCSFFFLFHLLPHTCLVCFLFTLLQYLWGLYQPFHSFSSSICCHIRASFFVPFFFASISVCSLRSLSSYYSHYSCCCHTPQTFAKYMYIYLLFV